MESNNAVSTNINKHAFLYEEEVKWLNDNII